MRKNADNNNEMILENNEEYEKRNSGRKQEKCELTLIYFEKY